VLVIGEVLVNTVVREIGVVEAMLEGAMLGVFARRDGAVRK